ncbi:hypothetical protein LXL04_020631 [Taraxacum kok-saghyz]
MAYEVITKPPKAYEGVLPQPNRVKGVPFIPKAYEGIKCKLGAYEYVHTMLEAYEGYLPSFSSVAYEDTLSSCEAYEICLLVKSMKEPTPIQKRMNGVSFIQSVIARDMYLMWILKAISFQHYDQKVFWREKNSEDQYGDVIIDENKGINKLNIRLPSDKEKVDVIKELLTEEMIEFFAITQLLRNPEQQLHKRKCSTTVGSRSCSSSSASGVGGRLIEDLLKSSYTEN